MNPENTRGAAKPRRAIPKGAARGAAKQAKQTRNLNQAQTAPDVASKELHAGSKGGGDGGSQGENNRDAVERGKGSKAATKGQAKPLTKSQVRS